MWLASIVSGPPVSVAPSAPMVAPVVSTTAILSTASAVAPVSTVLPVLAIPSVSTVSVPAPMGSAAITPSVTIAQGGMFLGEGLVPLPQKVKTNILNLEMQELLPENWPDLFSDDQAILCSLFGTTGDKYIHMG
jgi:hypothetical protein